MPLGYEKCFEARGVKEVVVADWARTPEAAAEMARKAERATVDIARRDGEAAVEGRDREGQGRRGMEEEKESLPAQDGPIALNIPVSVRTPQIAGPPTVSHI